MSGGWNPVAWVAPVFTQLNTVINQAVQSIGSIVNPIVNNALKDPVATIAQIGAYALAPETGGASLYALPAISATSIISHGGDVTKALESAGIQAATMGATDYFGGDLANALGVSPQTAAVITNSLGKTAGTLATTGDINKALTAGGTSALAGTIGSQVGGALKDELGSTASNLIGKVAGTTAASAATGKDPTSSIVNTLFSAALNQGTSLLGSGLKSLNDTSSQYNDQIKQATSLYQDQLLPAQQTVVELQKTAQSSYDDYKSVKDQYDSLVNQYNDAKSANNAAQANSFADQANALVPQLNAATEKYNGDAGTFQTQLDNCNTLNSQYTDSTQQLSSLKDQYDQQTEQLNKTSADFMTAAEKVAGMSNESQAAFTNLINTGADLSKAVDVATGVNSLSAPERAIYSNAVTNGLSVEQALSATPVASNMNTGAQGVYFNSLKNGEDPNIAANKALIAEVLSSGQGITPTQPEPTTTPVTNQNASVTVTGISDAELAKQGIIPTTAAPTEGTATTPETTPAEATTTSSPNLFGGLGTIPSTPTKTLAPLSSANTSSGLFGPALSSVVNSLYSGVKNAPGLSTAPSGISATPDLPTQSQTTPTTGTAPVASSKPTHLTGQYTQGTAVKLMDDPTFEFKPTAMPTAPATDNSQQIMQEIMNAATGGLVQGYADGGEVEGPNYVLRGSYTRGQRTSAPLGFYGAQLPGYQARKFAQGGEVEGHNPQFFSEGGLNSLENKYVQGEGDGTSDSVPAMLANGEFVIPADVVSRLGNGSNQAGASVLDQFLVTIREHAQKHDPKDLPPDSKGPLAYLLDAKRKA